MSACATPQAGTDKLALRSEQVLRIGLTAVDRVLLNAAVHSDKLSDKHRQIIAEVKAKAGRAFIDANDLRIAYKEGKASGSDLLTALSVVERLTDKVRLWVDRDSPHAASMADTPTEQLIAEAEADALGTPQAWMTAVPFAINLAKEVYQFVRDAKVALNQDRAWTTEEDQEFTKHLLATVRQSHWN